MFRKTLKAALSLCLIFGVSGVAVAKDLKGTIKAFEAHSGARLVFDKSQLRAGEFYDLMPSLSGPEKLRAAEIALVEVKKYPKGYLGKMGLRTVAIFEACVSKRNDGFRRYEDALGGYRYYGMWNGKDALVAAFYTEGQLPLTLHHEIFHHVDSSRNGMVTRREFVADDARFQRALRKKRAYLTRPHKPGRRILHKPADGYGAYPAPRLKKADRRRLHKLADGYVLRDAVSHYATKSSGEDQAETARYLMTALPDALLQIASKPNLPGSQRMLHVFEQYRKAVPNGPGLAFFVDVALGRRPSTNATLPKVDAEIQDPKVRRAIRAVQPASVRIAMGGSGVNLHPDGLILTAAHVPDRLGRQTSVLFPNGERYKAVCTHIDTKLDLAILTLVGAKDLPTAKLAARAAKTGHFVAIIGQPGSSTPDGEPTGYQPFHISTGVVRGYLPNLLGRQSLGKMKHDAWTYWGHSGSPLFDRRGDIIGLHNSWDSTTAMRHAVPWKAISAFLRAQSVGAPSS